ncbi:MAG: histidinol-phosphate aminotransferase family protein [Holophaga sp.]|nr:histidinol-phosphate aminotransferase family protein [Holophaga sp.]
MVPEVLPALRALKTYAVQEGRGAFLRMDFNEGPAPDLEVIARALTLCAFSATVYPEYGPLKRAAAQAWNVESAMVMPVNGADEGIAMLLRAFTGPGDAVVLPMPTFPMYRIYAEQCSTPVVSVPLKADFSLDVPALLKAIPQGALLSLTSPNNPTGRAIPEAELLTILAASEGKPVLMDETYAPFCGQDFAPLLARFPNLILLRTLSKAHGLPGLRCGFILANAQVIQRLEVLRAPFNVNGIAATLGAQILSSDPGLRARLKAAIAARERVQQSLDAAGITTVPTDAHFFMAQLGDRATAAVAVLHQRGILIKDLSNSLPGMVRISVAEAREADAFLEVFLPWWKQHQA